MQARSHTTAPLAEQERQAAEQILDKWLADAGDLTAWMPATLGRRWARVKLLRYALAAPRPHYARLLREALEILDLSYEMGKEHAVWLQTTDAARRPRRSSYYEDHQRVIGLVDEMFKGRHEPTAKEVRGALRKQEQFRQIPYRTLSLWVADATKNARNEKIFGKLAR